MTAFSAAWWSRSVTASRWRDFHNNLISITDGHIYLDPALYARGFLPAIDITRSVSRIGGKAQLPATLS